MYLHPARFNRFLAKMGQAADWRRGFACPCRNPRSGAADTNCARCRGVGTYWSDPASVLVAFSGQKVQAEWAKFGRWESGDQVMTLPSDSPAYGVGPFDRITMSQSSVPFSTVLRPGDRLREPVLSVDLATWFEGDQLVSAHVPAVLDDGSLAWPAEAPPEGAQVALTGRKRPEYFVLQEYPQDRAHHGGRDLPRRVVARKFDLFGRV